MLNLRGIAQKLALDHDRSRLASTKVCNYCRRYLLNLACFQRFISEGVETVGIEAMESIKNRALYPSFLESLWPF